MKGVWSLDYAEYVKVSKAKQQNDGCFHTSNFPAAAAIIVVFAKS
jgi:hypothetical protein